MIVVDIEAYDPNLHDMGDGAHRKDGHILCVGLYDGTDYVWCRPDEPRLKDWLASEESKCFHNGVYDLSWLMCGYGLEVNGIIHDTMTRAALIDEYAEMGLDACCKRHGVKGKIADDTIEKWFNTYKKMLGLRGNVWDNIDLVWEDSTGREQIIKYNQQDCIATYDLFMAQEVHIRPMIDVYKMECKLYPVIMEMKKNGIRIDEVARDRFTEQIKAEQKQVLLQLFHEYDFDMDIIRSPKKMTLKMNSLGIYSPMHTDTGGQSWCADALDLIDHPCTELIQSAKNYDALISKYLEASLQRMVTDGRIFTTLSPNKRDTGGTITGRLASKTPNLQNIPARDEKHGQKSYGQEMRQLFIPEEGCLIAASDYSQIEYILLAHYATGAQAEWFREQANAGVDFHTVAQQMTGIKSRDIVKRMNYGFIYGMGLNKLMQINRPLFKRLATEAGMEVNAFGKQVYTQYHERLPVIKDTMRAIENETRIVGYIESIGGRIHHKPRPQYDPIAGKWNDGLYKMTNYRIQGSAAEILKRGLIDCWNAGVFKPLKLHLTVHDENVVSVPYNTEGTEALKEMNYLMEQPYKDILKVPMKVACEVGENWGYWSDDIWKEMQQGIFNRRVT